MASSDTEETASEGTDVPPLTGEVPPRSTGCCKVERVARAYGLEAMDAELRRRRTDEGATLHELARYVNERLTATALAAGSVEVDAEPATVRAALQNDDSIAPDRRDQLREALAARLDLARLQTDFVSHETIRTHLNEHLGISTSEGGFDTRSELREALLASQDQYLNSIEGALARAVEREIIDGGGYSVYRTRVECEHCSTTYRLDTLIERGGCDCRDQHGPPSHARGKGPNGE